MSGTAYRVAKLSRNDRPFHVILAQQFDREVIDSLCKQADMIRSISGTRQGVKFLQTLLGHKRAMIYFTQPSTRTFLSFTSACQITGMRFSEVRSASVSSEAKGETEEDTVRTLSQYFDAIIMRHPGEGFAEKMANDFDDWGLSIPVINGGSGRDQHPTQALLDIYTLKRCLGEFAGKSIAFVGDLKRGRTVRSLSYLLTRYPGVNIKFVAPDELQISDDILNHLDAHNVSAEKCDNINEVLDSDAIYMTRLQDEYDVDGESKKIDYYKFSLTIDMAAHLKSDASILHPLPRRQELDKAFDTDPRAKYWDQVRNGMWMRAALLGYVFCMDAQVLEYYHENYTR